MPAASQKQLTDIETRWITLVGPGYRPRNGKGVLWKSAPDPTKLYRARICKSDDDKHLLYATVIEADTPDDQGDVVSPDECEATAHDFLENYRQRNVDSDHDMNQNGSCVVESFVLRGDDPMFPDTKLGSWCVVIHIINVDQWAQVKRGDISGVSLAGDAYRSHLAKSDAEGVVLSVLKKLGLYKAVTKPELAHEQEPPMPLTDLDKREIAELVKSTVAAELQTAKESEAARSAEEAAKQKATETEAVLTELQKSNKEMKEKLEKMASQTAGRASDPGGAAPQGGGADPFILGIL